MEASSNLHRAFYGFCPTQTGIHENELNGIMSKTWKKTYPFWGLLCFII